MILTLFRAFSFVENDLVLKMTKDGTGQNNIPQTRRVCAPIQAAVKQAAHAFLFCFPERQPAIT
jgi:hypothetical protein